MNKDVFQASEEDRLRMMNLCCCQPSDNLTSPPNLDDIAMTIVLSKRIIQLQKLLEVNGINVPEWPTFEEMIDND
jgi:hypothetical protein